MDAHGLSFLRSGRSNQSLGRLHTYSEYHGLELCRSRRIQHSCAQQEAPSTPQLHYFQFNLTLGSLTLAYQKYLALGLQALTGSDF